jgi:hypothetical protein
MRVRAALTASTIAVTTLALSASANTKSCNLVVDPKGDTNNDFFVQGQKLPVGFPASGSVDLVGGDLASNGTAITAVVKLDAIDPNEQKVINRRYVVQFKPAGAKYPILMAALFEPTATTYSFGYYGPSTGVGASSDPVYNYPGTATGQVNGNTISITANLADMAAVENVGAIKPGTTISALQVTSFRRMLGARVPPGYTVYEADTATTKKTYKAGAASCVTIG